MTSQLPLILVDGSSYLFRAFHALPPLTNSKGQPTGAAYGVVAMLKKLMQQHQPERIAVVFDASGKTFRDDMYPEYKANRPPMPDELRSQIKPLHELIRALGLPLVMESGVEADDVIGTLAKHAEARGLPVLISTSDKDMAQLVSDKVKIANSMTDTVMGIAEVIEKFGVPPERIVDYLALMGDSVDNIPGVPGVGPKTAAKWIQEFGSFDAVLARAAEVKGKAGENLRAAAATLPLSKALATIKCDCELPFDFDDLKPGTPNTDALRELYSDLEFKTWLKEILNGEPVFANKAAAKGASKSAGNASSKSGAGDEAPTETNAPAVSIQRDGYESILTEIDFQRWLGWLQAAELIAYDSETTSLDEMIAEIVGVSFSLADGRACYIPLAHDYLGAPTQLDRKTVLAALKPLLEDEQKAKIGHNIKYDLKVLANYGITLRGLAHDTMLESYVLDAAGTRHDMDTLALKLLGHQTISFTEIAGKGKDQLTFNQIDLETASTYAAEDADVTFKLHQQQWPRLQKEARLRGVYTDIEMPLVPVLARMERNGVLIDAGKLRGQSVEMAKRIGELEQQAYELAGRQFNLGSPKQLGQIFFEEMKLPVLQKTPTGAPSTNEEVLEELALDYPLPKLILEHRQLSKLKSTYTDKLPELVNPKTGRVHTSFNQTGAATGRLSSTDPNVQNIPIRTEEGRKIRQAFIAPKGHILMAADYSQIELRIMAHLSNDPGLMTAFKNGQDVHRATAAEIFEVAPEEVSSEMRRRAKAINFGLIYGMSAFGLARQIDVGREEAQHYMNRYFARYPGVEHYMNEIREQARQNGYVETLFGRRLYLPEIKAANQNRRKGAERVAINAPMQGTAADIVKRAMLAVDKWLIEENVPAKMLLQVHDELVLEVADNAVEAVKEKLRALMSGAAELAVPLVVDVGTGLNWDEAH
ncbi:DNA polymerase I [Permianibacter sp. IMCC34836]|uniref:DNA polymerase I n=1 Tax=Permianibacter fluminis TaxID=2738515 RepID=UPI00155351ED|nr:DNA polymerase I [Permianibacter fluminis]NQD36087.1 DNA polymerase I [Permianibacter fluminis]